MLNWWKKRVKVLGLNERNLLYIRQYNSRSAKQIADNKIITKKVLAKAGIPCTKIIHIISSKAQLRIFELNELPKSFVLKPANGVAGRGILVITKKNSDGDFVKADGGVLTHQRLFLHIQTILEGKFSLKNKPDIAIFEDRVKLYKGFKDYTYMGAPDIRILLFKRVPVMAMIRWPTIDSLGKANLSEGAAASGIDIATGITTHSIKESKNGRITNIEYVAGTKIRYSGVKIPYWDAILKYAVKSAGASGLGFCAVDFLIDDNKGPLIVELNARPGLRIQLVNEDGLKGRLRQLRFIKVKSDRHAIRLGKDLFGGEVDEEIEAIAGKKVISLIQPVTIFSKSGKRQITVKAKVDTGASYSSIDTDLAKKLGFRKTIKAFESYKVPPSFETKEEALKWAKRLHKTLIREYDDIIGTHVINSSSGHSYRIAVLLKCSINDKLLTIEANIRDRSQLDYLMIIGKNELEHFLIDPSK
ncbi:MAG: Ribosomal protein S6--L-glutamate ligase [Microgenomates bacterium OLB22]|nr:MAG: Ribosomal protein S6--L-glutamate ligase [Microgenomates bacterium OLB22]